MRKRSAVQIILLVSVAGLWTTAACAAGKPPKYFATPEEAAQALVGAVRVHDKKALLDVLGSGADSLISSGDAVADQASGERFVKDYDEANAVIKAGDDKATLQVGKDQWPFPIPIEKSDKGWSFNAAAGKEELLDRRIGRNELATIEVCLAYVDAQREYYERNPDHDKLMHYAQRIASTPGKRDGLYWSTSSGEEDSPLGALVAHARAEGYAGQGGRGVPYHGYYFHILTAQGPAAAGGAYDYIAHSKMIGGFGLVAYPANFGNSGVMTFIVNQDGVVFQKDLGPKSASIAKAMKTFNPDDTWKRVAAAQVAN